MILISNQQKILEDFEKTRERLRAEQVLNQAFKDSGLDLSRLSWLRATDIYWHLKVPVTDGLHNFCTTINDITKYTNDLTFEIGLKTINPYRDLVKLLPYFPYYYLKIIKKLAEHIFEDKITFILNETSNNPKIKVIINL